MLVECRRNIVVRSFRFYHPAETKFTKLIRIVGLEGNFVLLFQRDQIYAFTLLYEIALYYFFSKPIVIQITVKWLPVAVLTHLCFCRSDVPLMVYRTCQFRYIYSFIHKHTCSTLQKILHRSCKFAYGTCHGTQFLLNCMYGWFTCKFYQSLLEHMFNCLFFFSVISMQPLQLGHLQLYSLLISTIMTH